MSIAQKGRIAMAAAGNFFAGKSSDLTYISEGARWIIRSIGDSLVEALNDASLLRACSSITSLGARTPIVHFGSIHGFLTPKRMNLPSAPTRTVVTWFHIEPGDEKVARLAQVQGSVARIHTACSRTKNELVSAGISAEKISVIPLGINLEVFEPKTEESRSRLRAKLGIAPGAFVIGSFQKDGMGWADGIEPKLIKGPDVFIKVAAELSKIKKIHILLTGPGRGYIKKGLQDAGVPFTHIPYVEDGTAIAPYFNALDVYLVSSRIEGGPMAILESWASGVPLVATRVGLIPDIAQDGKNALLADVEDAASLVNHCLRICDDRPLAERLAVDGLTEVVRYDWSLIAQRYYDELYKPLL